MVEAAGPVDGNVRLLAVQLHRPRWRHTHTQHLPLGHTAGWDTLPAGKQSPLGQPSRWDNLPVGKTFPLGKPSRWENLPVGKTFPLGQPSRWDNLPVGTTFPLKSGTLFKEEVRKGRGDSLIMQCDSGHVVDRSQNGPMNQPRPG